MPLMWWSFLCPQCLLWLAVASPLGVLGAVCVRVCTCACMCMCMCWGAMEREMRPLIMGKAAACSRSREKSPPGTLCFFQHCLPKLPAGKAWVAWSPRAHCAQARCVFVWPGLLRTVEADHMPHQYFLGVPGGRFDGPAVFLTSLPLCLLYLLRARPGTQATRRQTRTAAFKNQ